MTQTQTARWSGRVARIHPLFGSDDEILGLQTLINRGENPTHFGTGEPVTLVQLVNELQQATNHMVVRDLRGDRILGMLTVYGPNPEERSLFLAAVKDPDANSVVFAEGFALYFDMLFGGGARKLYFEGSERNLAQFLHGAQHMFGGELVVEPHPKREGWKLVTLHDDVWRMSKYSSGRYMEER